VSDTQSDGCALERMSDHTAVCRGERGGAPTVVSPSALPFYAAGGKRRRSEHENACSRLHRPPTPRDPKKGVRP